MDYIDVCDDKNLKKSLKVHDGNIENDPKLVNESPILKNSRNVKEDPLAQCVFSVMNITYVFWFACLHVTIMFFLATFNMRATNVVNGDLEKGRNTFAH